MNSRLIVLGAHCLGWLLLSHCVHAEDWVRYRAQPGSNVKMEGTSTIHDWTVEAKVIGGYLELEPGFQLEPTLKPGKINAHVSTTIPVRQLKSGKKAMDDVMYETMKMPPNTNIVYRLTELVLTKVSEAASGPFLFDSKGELTVAGVTNVISMPITMEKLDVNKIKTTGKKQLKMTDFGMSPPAPKAFLGAIKTADEVSITFEWLTAAPAKSQ